MQKKLKENNNQHSQYFRDRITKNVSVLLSSFLYLYINDSKLFGLISLWIILLLFINSNPSIKHAIKNLVLFSDSHIW